MRTRFHTALLLALALAPPADANDPPGNVLVLLSDDQGIDMVESYGLGTDMPPTPNIDALAARGVLFRNAWAHPVCSPSRAALLTGRHATRTGMGWVASSAPDGVLRAEEVTLPEMLALGTHGAYSTAMFGKWHLGMIPENGGENAPSVVGGFDHFAGTRGNLGTGGETYFDYEKIVDGVAAPYSGYAATDKIDDALAWIATAPEPWFCYVAFHLAHSPVHDPPAHLHSFDLAAPGVTVRDRYLAMVETMDTELGRLVDGLDSQGLFERTTTMFLGDNGTVGGVILPPFDKTHKKGTLFEGGIRVPFIVAGRGVADPGRKSDALVSLLDVFATVADLADVDLGRTLPHVRLDSRSFAPVLNDPNHPGDRKVLASERFTPPGLGNGVPVKPTPVGPLCQEDLGFQGPGSLTLSVCGDVLVSGNTNTTLQVSGAPPFSTIQLYVSPTFAPSPFQGGTLVPGFPWKSTLQTANGMVPATLVADVTGSATLSGFVAQGKSSELFVQAHATVLLSPGALSNALRLEIQPTNVKAVRNSRFKLIAHVNGGPQLLFDLTVDPYEQNDLLAPGSPPLTPAQAAHLAALRRALARFL